MALSMLIRCNVRLHGIILHQYFCMHFYHMFFCSCFSGGLSDKIILLRNAIYDKRLNYMSLKLQKTNQGGVSLDPKRKDPCLADGCLTTVKSIYMDDLLEVRNDVTATIFVLT